MINPHDYQDAVDHVIDEVAHAIQKHGNSFVRKSDDGKLRIMVEEVGEVAEAIQEVENAYEKLDDERARLGGVISEATQQLVRDAERHLRDEIAQVGACAVRWLAGVQ